MISAIICAAGSGERAGFSKNKILQEYNELPLLCHSLTAFSQRADIGEIIIVCRREDENRIFELISEYPNVKICYGGKTRAESVYLGLQLVAGDIVLVHDAARPFVSQKTISNCIASVKKYGSGVAAIPATDTVAVACNGGYSTTNRADTYYVQTPQGFLREELYGAYGKAFTENKQFTDESGLYAHYVKPPHLVSGAKENIKLTYPEDFILAKRVGFGVDTHAFYADGEGAPFINFITLGGVRIPSEKILKAHSDGDVLVHALMDALLSAAGLRDIGYYFPDTDPNYKGANSMELLEKVVTLLKQEEFAPKNVSISILAETPRLSPYIGEMKQNLANALSLPPNAIGIAAGTNEKLGYVGEKKGITVYAIALLQ